jgi:hypothetical protein
MAEKRRPIHVGVVVGLSASVYALSLAGVTSLQATTNAELTTAQAPALDAAARLGAAHTLTEQRLDAASSAYDETAKAYADLTQALGTYENGIKGLAGRVGKIEGSSLSMPSSVSMPHLSASTTTSRPTVHACTTASGKAC